MNLPARISCAIVGWRFARQFFENAIELGKRLKTARERDLADWTINLAQLFLHFFEAIARNVINKFYASDLFEFFAQVGAINSNHIRHLGQRYMLGKVLVNKSPRRPNISGFGGMAVVGYVLKLNR
jgi:hypothetical protein